MKNKRLFSLLLVICALVVCALIVTACGGTGTTDNNNNNNNNNNNTNTNNGNTNTGNENEGYTYTVYFENQNGDPIEGVNAQLCQPGGFCLPPKTSDADGVCKFEFSELLPLEIQINEVPEGYIKLEGYIPFPEGKTSKVVTIQQNLTYTVTASDLYGQKLDNILVELYKEMGEEDELVESKITGENGRVEFTVSPDKYYAVVKHAFSNQAFKLVADSDVITFDKTKNVQVQFTISNDDIDYSVSLKDENGTAKAETTINVYNSRFELLTTVKTNSEGVATFKAPNGTYFVSAELGDNTKYAKTTILEKNGATNADINIEAVAAGSDKQHPIMLLGNINITLDSGAQLWYSVPFAKGKTVEINSSDVEVLYGGKTNKPSNGTILLNLKEEGEAAFRIKSTASEQVNVNGEIYKLGSAETPIEILVDSAYEFEGVVVEENGRVYYSFIAQKDGTIRITTDTENAVVSINGNIGKKSVQKDDLVVICFYTFKQVGDSISAPAATIDAELEFALTQADYEVTVKVDNQAGKDIEIELYEYVGTEYKYLNKGVCGDNGTYTFENLDEKATYYIKAIYGEDYETISTYNAFGDETAITIYVTHKRDGSLMYPYLVDSEIENNKTEVTLESNKEVWYTLFYITGATVSVDNQNVKAEIYTQTGDGEPVAVTTLTGENLEYVLNGNFGTTTRLLIKFSSSEDTTLNLTYTAPVVEEE